MRCDFAFRVILIATLSAFSAQLLLVGDRRQISCLWLPRFLYSLLFYSRFQFDVRASVRAGIDIINSAELIDRKASRRELF